MASEKLCGASGTVKLLTKEEIGEILAEIEKVFGRAEDVT